MGLYGEEDLVNSCDESKIEFVSDGRVGGPVNWARKSIRSANGVEGALSGSKIRTCFVHDFIWSLAVVCRN